MVVKLADQSMQAGTDGIVDQLDAGSVNTRGSLRLYTGAQPAEADTEPTGLLVELDFPNPAFGAATTSGVATANATVSGTASATGTALSAAYFDRDRNILWNCTVTASAGGGDLEITNTSITTGDVVAVSSLTFTTPQNQT